MRLRKHQSEALDAWRQCLTSGVRRGWIVLPPGAGKTLVGIEAARASGRTTVVFSPNTAIQGQWRSAAPEIRSLTYQSLAVFDPETEPADDSMVSRLHTNGLALIDELAQAGELMVILDECHHLLRTWGRLLAEILDRLPNALVLGLTATPASSMTRAEAELEAELFGQITYSASIPDVVVAGDLAPFAELVWVTTPTSTELDWLNAHQERASEFIAHVSDPGLASHSMFQAVTDLTSGRAWADVERSVPALADAVLRLHHAGLAELPAGAILRERHRRSPALTDWIEVINHWLRPLTGSEDQRDTDILNQVSELLPSLGYRWTRRGAVRGPATFDRVLARSAAKAQASVEILTAECENLGSDLRALVLCDFERFSALPRSLHSVADETDGSARQVLHHLLSAGATAGLRPLLVTGSTLGGHRDTVSDLARFAADRFGRTDLEITDSDGMAQLVGWSPRHWVAIVSAYFASGASQVLVGTRGLLGEGWDARSVNCLIDLTTATTAGAVVQMRGRALRRDPERPGKVAVSWSVVCIADGLLGEPDWRRLVRKHHGYIGPDIHGDLVDGIAHLDHSLSEHQAPAVAAIAELNARSLRRAEHRTQIARFWADAAEVPAQLCAMVRITNRRTTLSVPHPSRPTIPARASISRRWPWMEAVLLTTGILAGLTGHLWITALFGVGLAGLISARILKASHWLKQVAAPPGVVAVASAVADALYATGQIPVNSVGVRTDLAGEEIRCGLTGVSTDQSRIFAEALEEALSPVASPRYLVSRRIVTSVTPLTMIRTALFGDWADAQTWHPVPVRLGRRRSEADAYHAAWNRWVGEGTLAYASSPQGCGVLAASRGSDPWQLSTAIRLHWS